MYIERLTASSAAVLDLDRVRRHCRVDDDETEFDDVLTALIGVATSATMAWTGRALLNETWQGTCALTDPQGRLRLVAGPRPQLTKLEVMRSGAYVEIITADIAVRPVDADTILIRPATIQAGGAGNWGAVDCDEAAYRLTFTRGYGADASTLPAAILQAMLLEIGDLFSNRDASRLSNLVDNPAARYLLSPFRAAVV